MQGVLDRAAEKRTIDIAFGLAPRKIGRAPLTLSDDEQREADALIHGWQPAHWRMDEAARLLIALAGTHKDPETLNRLIRHADTDEQCALYRGLCLFPPQIDLHDAVGRGLRTHATPVFESIAHQNPWIVTQFDDHRWNHLILKAMFMEVALWPIRGFDERRNPELARMALDFADERRAADRPVPTELHRCTIPFASYAEIHERICDLPLDADGRWQDSPHSRALSLAGQDAVDPNLRDYIRSSSPHVDAIEAGTLNWSNHNQPLQGTP